MPPAYRTETQRKAGTSPADWALRKRHAPCHAARMPAPCSASCCRGQAAVDRFWPETGGSSHVCRVREAWLNHVDGRVHPEMPKWVCVTAPIRRDGSQVPFTGTGSATLPVDDFQKRWDRQPLGGRGEVYVTNGGESTAASHDERTLPACRPRDPAAVRILTYTTDHEADDDAGPSPPPVATRATRPGAETAAVTAGRWKWTRTTGRQNPTPLFFLSFYLSTGPSMRRQCGKSCNYPKASHYVQRITKEAQQPNVSPVSPPFFCTVGTYPPVIVICYR